VIIVSTNLREFAPIREEVFVTIPVNSQTGLKNPNTDSVKSAHEPLLAVSPSGGVQHSPLYDCDWGVFGIGWIKGLQNSPSQTRNTFVRGKIFANQRHDLFVFNSSSWKSAASLR
jgi:hypothetical protein